MPDTVANAPSVVTNGELYRAVELIRSDIKEVRDDVGKKPSTNDFQYLKDEIVSAKHEIAQRVTKEELRAALKPVQDDISEFRDWQKWISRGMVTVLGGMVINFAINMSQAGLQ